MIATAEGVGAAEWEVMMITTFDQRERAFEMRFAQDEELRFKANARRNRLLGLWAASKMGLVGPDAESYARELVTADVDNPSSDSVFEKVSSDFSRRGIIEHGGEVRRMMEEFSTQALAEMGARK
jgi:hypothetical protein